MFKLVSSLYIECGTYFRHVIHWCQCKEFLEFCNFQSVIFCVQNLISACKTQRKTQTEVDFQYFLCLFQAMADFWMVCCIQILRVFFPPGNHRKLVKAIPVHAWTGPEGSSRLRLTDFRISQCTTCLEIRNFQIVILNGRQWCLHWVHIFKTNWGYTVVGMQTSEHFLDVPGKSHSPVFFWVLFWYGFTRKCYPNQFILRSVLLKCRNECMSNPAVLVTHFGEILMSCFSSVHSFECENWTIYCVIRLSYSFLLVWLQCI